MRRHLRSLVCVFLLAGCGASSIDGSPDSSLVIKGSDTEVQLVSNLAEAFAKAESSADVSVTGGGSATGIASLLNGEIDIANSSRPMSEGELAQAKGRGMDVQEFILARDGLSVIVHPGNPLSSLTMDQIGAIYAGTVGNWKEVGGPDAPIVLYGRQSTSGTFGFFRDTVVKADYSRQMRQMEGSQAIVDGVRADAYGIGYVGVGYVKDESGGARTDIKILPVASAEGAAAVSPLDVEAVLRGEYPIFRPIFQYLPSAPAAGSLAERFLRFESSDEGQAIVEAAGFYRVTAADQAKNDAFLRSL